MSGRRGGGGVPLFHHDVIAAFKSVGIISEFSVNVVLFCLIYGVPDHGLVPAASQDVCTQTFRLK